MRFGNDHVAPMWLQYDETIYSTVRNLNSKPDPNPICLANFRQSKKACIAKCSTTLRMTHTFAPVIYTVSHMLVRQCGEGCWPVRTPQNKKPASLLMVIGVNFIVRVQEIGKQALAGFLT